MLIFGGYLGGVYLILKDLCYKSFPMPSQSIDFENLGLNKISKTRKNWFLPEK
jgi:hypothetical protein